MKLSEVKGFNGSEILFFVKFTKNEFVDTLVAGNLYMNPVKYFIELEEKSKERGQGDKLEGANIIKNVSLTFYEYGTDNVVLDGLEGTTIIERNHVYDKAPVFCMTAFTSKDFKIIDESDTSYTVDFDMTEEDKDIIKKTFGEKAVILNAVKFIDILDKHTLDNSVDYTAGLVNYYDYNTNEEKRIANYGKTHSTTIFNKDDFFKIQREFRIILPYVSSEDAYIFHIDNFNEIMPYVSDTSDLFNSFRMEILKKK